jgi:glycosyltransferase involved in cell wall biosynthesis
MRFVHLYRPRIPTLRAQAIQVLHSCHALARRGHRVDLFFHGPPRRLEPSAALAPYGLAPLPGLQLTSLSFAHPGAAGLEFRVRVLALLARARGERPVVYARTKRHAAQLGPWRARLGFRLIFESHEAESAQARERGEPHQAIARLERRVLGSCDALVCNCEGTLELLEEIHGPALPARRLVIHNGTDPDRAVGAVAHEGVVAGYLGSLRAYKNIHTLIDAAALLPVGFRVRILGGAPGDGEYERAEALAGPRVEIAPALPYGMVPEALAAMDVLVLSLGDDLYGRRLASPLKLWDYLATGKPVVAPDLPSVRAICGDAFTAYAPGDAASLASAIQRAAALGPAAPRLRSWDERAAEIEALAEELS